MSDDWEAKLTDEQRADWERFVKHHRENTVRQMDESAFVCSLVPDEDGVDIKFAVETGLAIMLDKPILAIAHPGATLPAKMVAVADLIVYADLDTEAGREKVQAAVGAMQAIIGGRDDDSP
jgi:predicted urease superfamily metal-dependent hydrolase